MKKIEEADQGMNYGEMPKAAKGKPFAEEAHQFLKMLGYYVYLRTTSNSDYDEYHEKTRKFLEDFKKDK